MGKLCPKITVVKMEFTQEIKKKQHIHDVDRWWSKLRR